MTGRAVPVPTSTVPWYADRQTTTGTPVQGGSTVLRTTDRSYSWAGIVEDRGSMGTGSYVAVGAGDPMSLSSRPHGAGRAYGRHTLRQVVNTEGT